MARIPIHYDSFAISNGRKGPDRQTIGRAKHHTFARDASDLDVSKHDHHIASLTSIDPADVATFRAVCLECQVVIVVRCPGDGARRFGSLGIGVTGKPEVEKEGLKIGHDLVRRGNGQLIVSDYDLMSVFFATGSTYDKLEFSRKGPGPESSWTNEDAKRLYERLNRDLNIAIEHGANDDWNWPGMSSKLKEIRAAAVIGERRFVAFMPSGDYRLLPSPGQLKSFYSDVLKTHWPY
jgi:hypothetical protein